MLRFVVGNGAKEVFCQVPVAWLTTLKVGFCAPRLLLLFLVAQNTSQNDLPTTALALLSG
jgi:hypothetical protein